MSIPLEADNKVNVDKSKGLPWWLGPEVIEEEEKKVYSTDESVQKKSDIPLSPVTFYFVGIRPLKAHQIKIISFNKSNNIDVVKIKFDQLTLNDNVNALKQFVFDEFKIPKTRKSLLIHYGDIKLSNDDELLINYGITDHSTFILAIYDNLETNHYDKHHCIDEPTEDQISRNQREHNRRERDLDSVKQRLKRIQDLRNGIKTDSNDNNQKKHNEIKEIFTLKRLLQKYKKVEMVKGFDIISQQKDVNCVKLPICDHILHKQSLYQYCLSRVMNREQALSCPHTDNDHTLCAQKWSYPLIKQCLLSNNHNDEYIKLELLLSRNIVELNYDLQKCPDCHSLLYRNPRDNNFVCRSECPLCPSTVFCWGCSEKWTDKHECDTSFRAATMEILSTCPYKKVGPSAKCPSVRACPKCNQLINHVSACKHMQCSFCKTKFCFICLKAQVDNKWKCGDSSSSCPTHKRQNHSLLPKLNQTSFSVF